jgi:hypothetical protein
VCHYWRQQPGFPCSGRDGVDHHTGAGRLSQVAFEFLFFHFVGGHSWSELLANYNIFAGRVWVVVLLWVAAAPYVFFHFRRPA